MAKQSLRQRRLLVGALLILCLCAAVLVGGKIRAFVHLFSEHAGVALTQEEVDIAHNSTSQDPRSAVVPKIIHQIFHNWKDPGNNTLPQDWEETRHTCMSLHPDWEYKLWDEEHSHSFIEEEFPWFLSTYDNFKFPVQRIDALRYFLMRRFGGIYIDLDNGCKKNLQPLLYYPVWVTDGGMGTLSNNILGAEPDHPYWIMMTESMMSYAWNYPFPYVTISYATGQWFETEIWERYHAVRQDGAPALTRVMMDLRPGAAVAVFFSQERGGTWDNWDNHVFGWIGEHILLTVFNVFGLVMLIIGLVHLVLFLMRRIRKRTGYRLLHV